MLYRNWTIKSHSTFLGYLAQYTSPTGNAHETSAAFTTSEQAISYARSRIDFILECERSRAELLKTVASN